MIPLADLLEPPAPVRAGMDEVKLEELADSIRKMGVLQQIIVVPAEGRAAPEGGAQPGTHPTGCASGAARFEIVAGHRRFLAARMACLTEIPAAIYQDGELAKQAAMLHENTYREDLSAAEEGWYYAELIEKLNPTEEELSRLVRQSPSYIYARLDMVRKDAEVSKAVASRDLSFAAARELLKCADETHRHYLLTMAVESGASARLVQSWVAQHKATMQPPLPPAAASSAPPGVPAPAENIYRCFLCGGDQDPQNLRSVYLHAHELAMIKKLADLESKEA